MTQNAIVTKIINNDTAEVMIRRGTECGDCESCAGACPSGNSVRITVANQISAAVGDSVILESRSVTAVTTALTYFLPIAAFIAAYALSDLFDFSERWFIICSIAGFFGGIAAAAIYRHFQNKRITFEIVAVN